MSAHSRGTSWALLSPEDLGSPVAAARRTGPCSSPCSPRSPESPLAVTPRRSRGRQAHRGSASLGSSPVCAGLDGVEGAEPWRARGPPPPLFLGDGGDYGGAAAGGAAFPAAPLSLALSPSHAMSPRVAEGLPADERREPRPGPARHPRRRRRRRSRVEQILHEELPAADRARRQPRSPGDGSPRAPRTPSPKPARTRRPSPGATIRARYLAALRVQSPQGTPPRRPDADSPPEPYMPPGIRGEASPQSRRKPPSSASPPGEGLFEMEF